jgi:hypothetical protein
MQPTVQQQALNILTLQEQASLCTIHTPRSLMKYAKMPINYKYYVCLMVPPITGQTISSYKTFKHDPATAEIWQTAFGRDFGGKRKGDNKMGQKGMTTMFVMMHDNIVHAHVVQIFFTYGNPVIDYHPQKESPHQISITARRNLINCESSTSVCMADLDTPKLHWDSIISTALAKYMCLDMKKF